MRVYILFGVLAMFVVGFDVKKLRCMEIVKELSGAMSCYTTENSCIYVKSGTSSSAGCIEIKNGENMTKAVSAANYGGVGLQTVGCATEFCNAKIESDLKEAAFIQTVLDNLAVDLKKQEDNLMCHNEQGQSVKCSDGVCQMRRWIVAGNTTKTQTMCSNSKTRGFENHEPQLPTGKYGLRYAYVQNADMKEIYVSGYCSIQNCNAKSEILDKLLENIVDSIDVEVLDDDLEVATLTSDGSFGSSPFLITLALLSIALL